MGVKIVTILGWERFNPRKDYKKPTWFALSNSILESPTMYDLSAEELKAWIYVLCQASRANCPTVQIDPFHAKKVCDVKESAIESMLEKLAGREAVQIENGSVQMPNAAVQNPYSTDRQTDRQTSTYERTLPRLAEIWNEHCGSLSKIEKTNAERNRKINKLFAENSESEWAEIIRRVAKSDFCNGKNERGWKATFGWLLQKETHLKVSEGRYDNPKNLNGKDAHRAIAESFGSADAI